MDGFKAADGNKSSGLTDIAAANAAVPVIVICEECGRKYRIDTGSIEGAAAGFSCRNCGHRILVNKERPDALGLGPDEGVAHVPPSHAHRPKPQAPLGHQPPAEEAQPESVETLEQGARWMGSRARRVLPGALGLLIAGVAGFLFMCQMGSLMRDINRVSSQVLNRSAEEKIFLVSASVAAQCRTYLMAHSDLPNTSFARDPAFGAIALQPVGKTGTTTLIERSEDKETWRIWVHTDSLLNGSDLSTLRRTQGGHFDSFWKVVTGVRAEVPSSGYYLWRDPDGKYREKFMVCTAVPGTPYVIAAALESEELEAPALAVEKRIAEITRKAGLEGGLMFAVSTLAILGVALLTVRKARSASAGDARGYTGAPRKSS